MKKIFTILLFLIVALTAQATNYYIRTDGSNGNTGMSNTSGDAWQTLAWACAHATVSGDIIHVAAGTYTETSQSVLTAGVSIEGAGVTSIILSHVGASNWTIELYSSTENTNGNQHISNIKMNGDALTGKGAIGVLNRRNVEIYNCTFVDFSHYGVAFVNGSEPPATAYATGNKFHDNIVTNCAGFYSGAQGDLWIGGQDGLLIYNNTITQNRGTNDGDCIYGVEGYIKNVKIYNNTISKTFTPGVTSWDFAIEIWDYLGGNEIYNNIITGSIDVGGYSNTKGSSTYSVWIHDNIIGQTALTSSESARGVLIESTSEDVIVERNYIKNVAVGIYFTQVQSARNVENIRISYNIFYNIGVSDAGVDQKGWGINFSAEDLHNHTVNNINIWNNIFIGSTGARSNMWGIKLPDIGTVTNVSIRNNIIQNFDYAPIYAGQVSGDGVTIDYLSIENNIFYNNGNSDVPLYSSLTPTHNTTQNNLTSNPLFVSTSDFHLQAGSPAINTGIYAGLTTDYAGSVVNNPPEIGAYEYGSTGTVPMTSFTLSSAGSATTITTYHGTLQFYTSGITPSNTTDQTFTWSVINGTGSATISSLGLLTAVTNGTVTVRATAHDGSGVYGIKVITLSNQTVTGYPVIITTILTDTSPTTATLGGNVTADGGLTVTNRGLCYGASANPTTSNSVIQAGTGTGVFVAQIIGLTVGGTYHVRAFATNSTGTSYGADIVVSTRAKYIVTY